MPADRRKPRVAISSTQSAMRVPRKRITELVDFIARAEDTAVADVDVAVVSAGEIATMNRRYLSHAGATDVLSFDLSDAEATGISAQIVVCGDVAVRQAKLRDTGVQRELLLYVAHGLLHLMGYDDAQPRTAARMHAREEELLDAFWQRR